MGEYKAMWSADDDDEFNWFFRAIPLVLIPVFVAALWLAPSPAKPLANDTVFGCYAAPASVNIQLDEAGMHIEQPGFPLIPYHLERSKTGIVLTADAPIRADKTALGYRFGINKRGIGWFMPLYRIENGQTYGVFDESLLEGFQMLASDGITLNYVPVTAAECG